MRLSILDSGHPLKTKALFFMIKTMTRHPVADVVKTLMYRPDYFGRPLAKCSREAMRGESEWSVADRELMAAYVSKVNECEF